MPRIAIAAAVLALLGAPALAQELPDPRPKSPVPDEDVERGILYLNEVRISLGLAPVDYDETSSKACLTHARYLLRHGGAYAHFEDPKHGDYDAAGDRAAHDSVVSMGPESCVGGCKGLLNTFLHRIPLLDPKLEKVGLARAGGVVLYEYRSGRTRKDEDAARAEPVLYPADGWDEVPVNWSGEGPRYYSFNPAATGSPITATFFGKKVTDVRFELKVGRRRVPVHLWTPEDPAHEMWPDNMSTVSAFTKAKMPYSTRFTCELACKVDGEPKVYLWSFRTMDPPGR